MFEPIDEILSFWHWWEKCKRGNNKGKEERREERLEEENEEDPSREE